MLVFLKLALCLNEGRLLSKSCKFNFRVLWKFLNPCLLASVLKSGDGIWGRLLFDFLEVVLQIEILLFL